MLTCPCCFKQYTRKAAYDKHRASCTAPISTRPNRQQVTAMFEDIRISVTNVDELFRRLRAAWLSLGIEVIFTSFPSTYNPLCSNSHASPHGYPQNWCSTGDAAGIPKGYPGWTGTISGTVRVVDSSKLPNYVKTTIKPYFSDLLGHCSNSPTAVSYVHTHSGGGGDHFSFSSSVFVYDFPEMHAQWRTLHEYEHKNAEFNTLITQLSASYDKQKAEYVSTHASTRQLTSIIDSLQSLLTSATKDLQTTKKSLDNAYRRDNPFDVPAIPSAFVDYAPLNQATLQLACPKGTVEQTSTYLNRLTSLANELTIYRTVNAELFV